MRANRLLFLAAGWLFCLLALGSLPCLGEDIEAITKPSADIELSFVKGGRVAEVLVKEGETVKEGQLLARQDDKVEQIQLLQLMAKAENQTSIEAARAEMLQKEEDLKKIEGAKKKGAATDWEVEHARLDVSIARLKLQMARFEHEQDRRKYEEARADIERLRLLSPIDGQVEEVVIEPGESPQPMKLAVRVVKTGLLWIDIIAPLALARNLKPGQTASVVFPGHGVQGVGQRIEGRISFVSAVARAGSDTLRVRVEVANPGRRPAGERVGVSFSGSESTPARKGGI
jgi:RND family efflux transporter MFP subunit